MSVCCLTVWEKLSAMGAGAFSEYGPGDEMALEPAAPPARGGDEHEAIARDKRQVDWQPYEDGLATMVDPIVHLQGVF
jgi:hypothetical protein